LRGEKKACGFLRQPRHYRRVSTAFSENGVLLISGCKLLFYLISISAYLFNKMWRSTDALQMAMILPLLNVTLDGNINIFY
jgi:hypothetical protein